MFQVSSTFCAFKMQNHQSQVCLFFLPHSVSLWRQVSSLNVYCSNVFCSNFKGQKGPQEALHRKFWYFSNFEVQTVAIQSQYSCFHFYCKTFQAPSSTSRQFGREQKLLSVRSKIRVQFQFLSLWSGKEVAWRIDFRHRRLSLAKTSEDPSSPESTANLCNEARIRWSTHIISAAASGALNALHSPQTFGLSEEKDLRWKSYYEYGSSFKILFYSTI